MVFSIQRFSNVCMFLSFIVMGIGAPLSAKPQNDLDFDALYQQAEQCGATHIKRESHPVMDTAIKYLKIIFVPIFMAGLKAKRHLTSLFYWTKQRAIILFARAKIMKNYVVRRIAQENARRS